MRVDLWRRLEDLFSVVLESPEDQRRALVEQHCSDDSELRTEALSFLEAFDRSNDFLQVLDADLAGRLIVEQSEDESAIGRQIGPFRVTQELGHGGMGTVYLAERVEGEFEQAVALKVIRWSGLSFQLKERFYAERQILARLDHPGIARLLDGGITEQGEPYFAMEVVDGKPITAFCDERLFSVAERLSLFLEVCEAVRYAHRRLVVHRDLKPSNILINLEGRPKLVDFGIAQALTETDQGPESEPAIFGVAATPEYTAPEVIAAGTITTGADVFSLGVVLHEVLTGRRPASTPTSETSKSVLKGDLGAIIHRAIERDPDVRYRTIEDFEEDLRRFLDSRPVAAHPDTNAYRLRKFVRRNRGTVTAGLLIALALLSGLIVSIAQTREARQQAARAEEIKDFLIGAFNAAAPGTSRGETLTARQILDAGARRINVELADQPALKIELQMVLGSIYRELGHFAESDTLLADALSSSLTAYDDADPRLGSAIEEFARLRLEQSRLEEADSLFRRALDIKRRAFGSTSPETAASLSGLGTTRTQLGEFEQAERLHREALDLDRAALGGDNLTVADDLQNLGWVLWRQARYGDADSVLTEALGIQRSHLNSDDHKVAITLSTLGKIKSSLGEYGDAEAYHREALALRRKILGENHPDVALSLSDLALAMQRQGRLDEAASLFEEALNLEAASLGADHAYTINTLNNLAICYYQMGDIALGVDRMRRVVELRKATVGADHADALTAANNLAAMLHTIGSDREALDWLNNVIETRESQGREGEIDNGYSLKNLGDVLSALSLNTRAEDAYYRALTILRSKLPSNHTRIADAEAELGALLVRSGDPDRATPLLREAVAIRSASLGPFDRKTARAKAWLSKALAASGKPAEAVSLRREVDSLATATGDEELRELLK